MKTLSVLLELLVKGLIQTCKQSFPRGGLWGHRVWTKDGFASWVKEKRVFKTKGRAKVGGLGQNLSFLTELRTMVQRDWYMAGQGKGGFLGIDVIVQHHCCSREGRSHTADSHAGTLCHTWAWAPFTTETWNLHNGTQRSEQAETYGGTFQGPHGYSAGIKPKPPRVHMFDASAGHWVLTFQLALPGGLLEMQSLRPHPRPTKSELAF